MTPYSEPNAALRAGREIRLTQTPFQLSWSLQADPPHNESNDHGSNANEVT